MLGPSSGIIQALAGNQALGPEFDLYAEKPQPAPSVLPLGPVPQNLSEVEIRVVGKNPRSQGTEASLDYFRWEPTILGPGTADGIWTQVVGTRDCEYRPQDLGMAYSGGHQFWVQPCNRNGWVDIAVEIPQGRTYEIAAKYTKSWDYAHVQAFIDGKPIGPAVDTYSQTVVPMEPLTLGRVELAKGRHILRFQAVDHNPKSQGYLMGIDHVIIR